MNIPVGLMIIKNQLLIWKNNIFSVIEKNNWTIEEDLERTKEIDKQFNIRNGEKISKLYLKSDVILLNCVFKKLARSIN